jgi:hypothetical protein
VDRDSNAMENRMSKLQNDEKKLLNKIYKARLEAEKVHEVK